MNINIENWKNMEIGIIYIAFGALLSFYCSHIHKKYKNKGYRLFQVFRRPDKSQSEDNIFIILYVRSVLGIYAGYGFMVAGIFLLIDHLFNLKIFQ